MSEETSRGRFGEHIQGTPFLRFLGWWWCELAVSSVSTECRLPQPPGLGHPLASTGIFSSVSYAHGCPMRSFQTAVFPGLNPSFLLVPINLPEAFAERPLVADCCHPGDSPSDPLDPPLLRWSQDSQLLTLPVPFAACPWRAEPLQQPGGTPPPLGVRPENPGGFLGDERLRDTECRRHSDGDLCGPRHQLSAPPGPRAGRVMGTGRVGCPRLCFSWALLEGSTPCLERETDQGKPPGAHRPEEPGRPVGRDLGISIVGWKFDLKAEAPPSQGTYQSGYACHEPSRRFQRVPQHFAPHMVLPADPDS